MVAYSARRSYCFTLQINKKYLEYQCDWLSFLELELFRGGSKLKYLVN